MLSELLQQQPNFHPGRWQPCPPVSDRDHWDALPCSDRWLAQGSEVLHSRAGNAVPALPLSLWHDFSRTGNRSRFEAAYFNRRRTLCRLVMSECAGYSGSFLGSIADYVWAICEESAWQLPAHNSYIRDTPQLPLPKAEAPIIDLFAAETGALLAMVHFLLGKELEARFPGICHRMERELTRRVLTPYRTRHFWWMGNGSEPMCNWTAWCTQNVLITSALMRPRSADFLRGVVRQAAYSLDCFLKDYGEDGCCNEGTQYYRHAGLCLYNALEILCALAPGVFDDVWQQPKIHNLAEYIVHMHVQGPYYLNFSDCSPLAGSCGVREYLFGKRVGSVPMMALAAADFAADLDPDVLARSDASEGINLFYHIQTAFVEAEIRQFFAVSKKRSAPAAANIWYPSVGLLCCRAGVYTAGMKAGCNADSHNHNDTGSVTLYKGGHPLLIDVGVGSYTKKTFSPQRYEIWTMQSSWHNLPEFDPSGKAFQQQPGTDYRAVEVQVLPGEIGLSMNLAPAYTAHGEVPGLTCYHRTLQLTEQGLSLTDETDFPGVAALSLMSQEQPAVQGETIFLGAAPALGRITVQGAERITVESVSITDSRLRHAWPDTLYRIRLYFGKSNRQKGETAVLRLTVE